MIINPGSTADRSAQKGSMHLRLLVWPWLAAARLVQRVERQWFEDAGLTWSEDDAPRDASTLPRFEESVDYWPRRAGAEPERVIAIYHGHDASIAVSVGGEVRCVLELERLFGVRFYRLPDENEDLPAFRDDLTAALGVVRDRCLAGESTRFHLAVLQAPLLFLPRVLHDAGFVVERWAYVDHATAHAASAFYASPFSSALTIVSDGTMSNLSGKQGRGSERARREESTSTQVRRVPRDAGQRHVGGLRAAEL